MLVWPGSLPVPSNYFDERSIGWLFHTGCAPRGPISWWMIVCTQRCSRWFSAADYITNILNNICFSCSSPEERTMTPNSFLSFRGLLQCRVANLQRVRNRPHDLWWHGPGMMHNCDLRSGSPEHHMLHLGRRCLGCHGQWMICGAKNVGWPWIIEHCSGKSIEDFPTWSHFRSHFLGNFLWPRLTARG